eukprot:TRINITY_DN7788_c0_g1_i3.p1 TRINITY_DN7788_c0_g1~~TRINITY_DN7788_c0_g1_i3.p1  ORF type:complete len:152 (-),score=26.87 TRINITY_DN7788_c0_g1_i3:101-556(-)
MVVWITAFGIGVFAWVVVSALLTRVFPALIHPRNRRWDLVPKSKRPFRIAHRGGASEAPETTIAAFEHAHQCGEARLNWTGTIGAKPKQRQVKSSFVLVFFFSSHIDFQIFLRHTISKHPKPRQVFQKGMYKEAQTAGWSPVSYERRMAHF